jgi:hypothetical protein
MNFIFRWKLSVMPLFFERRHMQAMGSAQERKVLARVFKGSMRLWASRPMKPVKGVRPSAWRVADWVLDESCASAGGG